MLSTPLTNIAAVARHANHAHTQPQIEGERLILTQAQSTNVLVRFAEPVAAEAPAPHVIAHDIGGAVALGAHLVEGARMASLYLLDIVTLDPWGSPFFRLVAQHEEAFAALPGNLHAALVREYIAGAAHGTLAADLVAALARPWCTEDGQPAFYRQIAQLSPEQTRPIAEALGTVSCPVRVAWGEADPWIPSTQAAELAARLPGDVDAVLFPGAGHLVPLEAGDHLAADIAAWVGAHGSPGSVGPHTAG